MLFEFTEYSQLKKNKLMEIYRQGNLETADRLYPHVADRRFALRLAERDFIDFLAREFFRPGCSYMVLVVDDVWLSALRLTLVEEGLYYIEALETRPDRRREGNAVRLLRAVITVLSHRGPFILRDCVSKENLPSLRTHRKAGFTVYSDVGYDYLSREHKPHCYGLEYRFTPEREAEP